MTLTTISIIAATVIYLAYNAICLALFGIPKSLSDTYYLWKEHNGKGYLFCLMMYVVVALMMPAWITMSEGSDYQFLAFLAPAAIAFVGAAPAFMGSRLENRVHSVSAIFAAGCSLAWVVLVTPYWYVILIWFAAAALRCFLTKSLKTSMIYWLECIAFGSTFTAAIAYSLN